VAMAVLVVAAVAVAEVEAVQLAQAVLLTAFPGRRDHLLCLVKLARSLALSQRLQRAAQLHRQLQLQLPAAIPTPVLMPARVLPALGVLHQAPWRPPTEPVWIAARLWRSPGRSPVGMRASLQRASQPSRLTARL
jgi:hypothetical protein